MYRFGYPAPTAICLSSTSKIHRNFLTFLHNARQWHFTRRTIGIKVKVKFTLEQATKAQRGSGVKLYSFFNLGTRCGWVVNAMPRQLYFREKHGTSCTGGWVGPRAGLDGGGKSRSPPGFDPRTAQPVASRYTD
jgi:hypothetical protein